MKNFSIDQLGTYYRIKYSNCYSSAYLWKSPKTGVIHKVADFYCASEYKTREAAMLVIEEFLNQK